MKKILIENIHYKLTKINCYYTISYNYNSPLISSLIRSIIVSLNNFKIKIINQTENSLSFHSFSLETLENILNSITISKKIVEKSNLILANKATNSLINQLKFLLKSEDLCFIGYNPEDIIIINEELFIVLNPEYLESLNSKKQLLITRPFTLDSFYQSPELLQLKNRQNQQSYPYLLSYKCSYYSLGCLLLYILDQSNEVVVLNTTYNKSLQTQFQNQEENKPNQSFLNLIDYINANNDFKYFKYTKFYYFLIKALKKEPNERYLINI